MPNIRACIVCEGVRQEILGKWTLLGFFGVAPVVRVSIGDFSKAVTLCFVFGGDEFVGTLRASLNVIAPSGVQVSGATDAVGEFFKGKPATMFFMQYQSVMPGPGRYTVIFTMNGQEAYRTTVDIDQGDAQDMARRRLGS
jgi:hypothetical protein